MGNAGSSGTSFGTCGTCSQGGTYFFGAPKSTSVMQKTDGARKTAKAEKVPTKLKLNRYYKGYVVRKNKKGRYILKKKRKIYLKTGARTYSSKEASLAKKMKISSKSKTSRFG